jgi:multiple sugar transport system permease protein/putative aldouronate transport system permease protein
MSKKMRLTRADKVYLAVVYTLVGIFTLVVSYPLIYVLSCSFSDPDAVYAAKVYLWPVNPGLQGYKAVFTYPEVWTGYRNSIYYTVMQTIVGVSGTMMGGYVLSRKEYPLRKFCMILFVITMFFGGGLIPFYILITKLRLVDTYWSMILPGAFSFGGAIIVRTFITSSIPEELFESLSMDGGTYADHFFKIVLPLCAPIIAVQCLNQVTGTWNSWFSPSIFIRTVEKYPLQLILRRILVVGANVSSNQSGFINNMIDRQAIAKMSELLKYSLIIVSSAPLLVLYPFMQRYFMKGMIVGSLKG